MPSTFISSAREVLILGSGERNGTWQIATAVCKIATNLAALGAAMVELEARSACTYVTAHPVSSSGRVDQQREVHQGARPTWSGAMEMSTAAPSGSRTDSEDARAFRGTPKQESTSGVNDMTGHVQNFRIVWLFALTIPVALADNVQSDKAQMHP
jgi:hypothetical protein